MRIQNAPLDKDQLARIAKYITGMENKKACAEETGIDQRTINAIIEREWGSIKHIEKLMAYCDGVENFSKTIA